MNTFKQVFIDLYCDPLTRKQFIIRFVLTFILSLLLNVVIDTLDKMEKAEDIVRVRKYVDAVLTDREKEIIVRRYGLNGAAPVTQKKVGTDMGISRSYVSRIEKKALEKLKKAFDNTYIT